MYAKQKDGVDDLKKVAAAKIYLDENKIYTVSQLAEAFREADKKVKSLKSALKKNNSRLRDISDVMKAATTIQKHQAVWKEYSSIQWKGSKQKFYDSHNGALEAYKKADRHLRKLKVSLPLDEPALREESSELSQKNEQLHAELETAEKKFVVFCEGDTEFHYIDHMRKNQGVEISMQLINMKGGGYTNFLNEIRTKAQTNCLAKFIYHCRYRPNQ